MNEISISYLTSSSYFRRVHTVAWAYLQVLFPQDSSAVTLCLTTVYVRDGHRLTDGINQSEDYKWHFATELHEELP